MHVLYKCSYVHRSSTPWVQVSGAAMTSETCHFQQLLWGDTEVFPGQQRHLFSLCPGSAPRSPPRWVFLKQVSARCLNHLIWLLLIQRSRSSTWSLEVWVLNLISMSEPWHPVKKVLHLCSSGLTNMAPFRLKSFQLYKIYFQDAVWQQRYKLPNTQFLAFCAKLSTNWGNLKIFFKKRSSKCASLQVTNLWV